MPTTTPLRGLLTRSEHTDLPTRDGGVVVPSALGHPSVGLRREVVEVVTTILLLIALISVAAGCAGNSDASRPCETAARRVEQPSIASDCPHTPAVVPPLPVTASPSGDALLPRQDGVTAGKGVAGRTKSPGTARAVRDRRGLEDAWPTPPSVPGSSSLVSLR